MRKLKDISGGERYAWASLLATGIVGFHFFGRITEGFAIVEHAPAELMGLYIRIIIMFIVLHIVIAIMFVIKKNLFSDEGELYDRDERDIAIERKGDRYGFWVLIIAVEIIIFMLLFEHAYPEKYTPAFSVLSASGLFFALMSCALLADFFKRIVMIAAYRP